MESRGTDHTPQTAVECWNSGGRARSPAPCRDHRTLLKCPWVGLSFRQNHAWVSGGLEHQCVQFQTLSQTHPEGQVYPGDLSCTCWLAGFVTALPRAGMWGSNCCTPSLHSVHHTWGSGGVPQAGETSFAASCGQAGWGGSSPGPSGTT